MTDTYESPALLRQYLDFHYRSGETSYLPHHELPEGLTEYPQRCGEVTIEYSNRYQRALDLGCAVGGSSFTLATAFDEVVGIDFSDSFIDAATQLASTGTFRSSEVVYTPSSDHRKCRPHFRKGNACALPQDLGCFDAILMSNLLCRLPDPTACLEGLKALTQPGSILVFTTPCSWDEAFTPREKWLWPTLEGLHQTLDPWCETCDVFDIPFVLKDHDRRAQFTVAQASVWEVKA
ncbi:methyltransferase domain-containing protein [Kiritimatiellota bacterium B12222]|nr:methyltransferase domain-containing protein [Kiritimatiellota bacterium B12222]